MKFNKDTQFEELSGTCFEGFYELKDGGLVVLYRDQDNGEYLVVSFDKHEFCNNASSLPREKAWKLFMEIVQEDLGD